MAIHGEEDQPPSSFLDSLYCEEEDNFEDQEEGEEEEEASLSVNPMEYDELTALLWKEERQHQHHDMNYYSDYDISKRKQVVEWMLMVNNYFGFSALTSVLSVDYLDRFLARFCLHQDKPWSLQLAAVACLSLAAKVEETFVPLLVDLQIEGTKYMFEAKNIQKMELLVLSTLEWKMHPVTPMSFLHHIIQRLRLNHHFHWEFITACESLLLSLLLDGRFVGTLPSAMAAAIVMHVIDGIHAYNALHYHNQLLGIFQISKDKVNKCYQEIKNLFSCESTSPRMELNNNETSKRKWDEMMMMRNQNSSTTTTVTNSGSSSPSGVIDASYSYLNCNDSSNDSWTSSVNTTTTATTTATEVSSYANNNDIAMSLSRKKGRLMSSPRVFFVDV